jgi:Threonine dehydrogenase and related Zn-dependent dehydrogenases
LNNIVHKREDYMKALVYHGPGKRGWEEKPKLTIKNSTDAIIRITKTTICGTDLHIMKGDVPEVIEGLILGHEGVGDLAAFGRPFINNPDLVERFKNNCTLSQNLHMDLFYNANENGYADYPIYKA